MDLILIVNLDLSAFTNRIVENQLEHILSSLNNHSLFYTEEEKPISGAEHATIEVLIVYSDILNCQSSQCSPLNYTSYVCPVYIAKTYQLPSLFINTDSLIVILLVFSNIILLPNSIHLTNSVQPSNTAHKKKKR